MTQHDQHLHSPISFAGGVLDPYRHVCAFVNSKEEEYRTLDPFVSEGLAQGDKLLYIVDPRERASLVRHLGQLGHDTTALLEQRQTEVHTWSDTYLRGGSFDREGMVHVLDEILSDSPSPRIRMITDMGWAVEEEDFSDVMIEYEAQASYVHPKHAHVVICVYDTAKFGGDIVIDVLRTHPMVLIGGVLQVNPFFVPPDEFLASCARASARIRMADSDPLGSGVAAALVRDGDDTTAQTRRTLRDLAALLALPAMWVDNDPADIAVSLLGVLFGVFRLESAYARFDDPNGRTALERWRPDGPQIPVELEPAFAATLDGERGTLTVSAANPSGSDSLRITSMASAFPGRTVS
ncbi:MAG: MEDS domain-containing protein [Thermomicrobiales bacterium]